MGFKTVNLAVRLGGVASLIELSEGFASLLSVALVALQYVVMDRPVWGALGDGAEENQSLD